MHFLCHGCKIRNVLCWLMQISKRQRNTCCVQYAKTSKVSLASNWHMFNLFKAVLVPGFRGLVFLQFHLNNSFCLFTDDVLFCL